MNPMPEQPNLPGLDATASWFTPDVTPAQNSKLQWYTLFLAIVPQTEDAHRLAQAAADLCTRHELSGESFPPERLHVTLHAIASFMDAIPQAVVDAAIAASASVACPPFTIVFDQVLSFEGGGAFVLRCDAASDSAIARLRQPLARALRRAGLHPKASATPHMTMLYDRRRVTEHAIEPVAWTAKRFALILSHVGIGHHQRIAEWALTDRP